MIIWRGWGILGVAIPAAGAVAGLLIWTAIGQPGDPQPLIGPLLALAGVGTFFAGRHLNVTGVQTKAQKLLAPRRDQLDALVTSGQFQLAPGMPQPRSLEEAHQQANGLYQQELAQVGKALRNRHTLFFIPFQYVGILAVAIGISVLVTGLVG